MISHHLLIKVINYPEIPSVATVLSVVLSITAESATAAVASSASGSKLCATATLSKIAARPFLVTVSAVGIAIILAWLWKYSNHPPKEN